MTKILNRIKYRSFFLFKYKTIKPIIKINNDKLCVSSSKGNYIISRMCPHQGAYLEKGYLKDNVITCHWHGCKIYTNIVGVKA